MTGEEYATGRKALGLSQDDLAAELCVSRATIGRVEAMPKVPVLHEKAMQLLLSRPRLDRA